MPNKCAYKEVNGDCSHPSNDRNCGVCVPTDETIANAMPKMAEDGVDGVTIEEVTPLVGMTMTDNRPTTRKKVYSANAVHMGFKGKTLPAIESGLPPLAKLICYQCEKRVCYLFDDGRCVECTRLTPDEVRGG